jgi:hypothetical protein
VGVESGPAPVALIAPVPFTLAAIDDQEAAVTPIQVVPQPKTDRVSHAEGEK